MTPVSSTDINAPAVSVSGTSRTVKYNVAPHAAMGNAVVATKDPLSEIAAVGAAVISKIMKEVNDLGNQIYEKMFSKAGIKLPQSTRPGALAGAQNQKILNGRTFKAPTVHEANKIIAKNPAPSTQTAPLPAHIIERRNMEQRVARAGLGALKTIGSELVLESLAAPLVGPVAALALAFATPKLQPNEAQLARLLNRRPSVAALRKMSAEQTMTPENKNIAKPKTAAADTTWQVAVGKVPSGIDILQGAANDRPAPRRNLAPKLALG